MFVRPYEVGDFATVSHIDGACHPWHTPDDVLSREIEEGRTWVHGNRLEITGFLIAKYKQRMPYVYNVAILPTFRKRGYATDLLTVFHNHFAAYDQTWLQVDANNPAQKLYFDLGYRTRRIERGLYGPETYGLDMYRTIKK